MRTLFITNDLSDVEDKQLFDSLTAYTVIGKSLVRIEPIPFQHVADSDWIFFYSKTAVSIFHAQIQALSLTHIWQRKIGTIGQETANHITKLIGRNIDLILSTKPSSEDLIPLLHQKVLFPRAAHSRKTIENLLPPDQVIALPCYDNTPLTDYTLPDSMDVLVITSPMNADAIFNGNTPTKLPCTIISIGSTTQLHLLDRYHINSIVPTEPSMEAVVGLVREV